ncbi:hypothetical protein OIE75_31345 [Streptomyces sp. NBC_01723]|uniref:nSTAND1 domain-containing NTPase n=1 Tax=unclassified Streptomyces TaxID=2593676 RepID=UPI002788F80C|nr:MULTISPECIES: hypothetical protein [unclassified Streptomyces]MDQ0407141.1 hypothetical protein [Streptomyces sp. DSM 40167]
MTAIRDGRLPKYPSRPDPDGTRAVLDRLVRARLLTLDDGTVALAHEALITAWPRLRGWTDPERDRLRVHRVRSEAARTWTGLGRENAALYADSRLAADHDAFQPDHDAFQPDHHAELTPTEREFLAASTGRRRRAVWLRRGLPAALALLVPVASGTAVVALRPRDTARAERDDAVFGRITAEADRLRPTSTPLSARLDAAALGMRSTPELATARSPRTRAGCCPPGCPDTRASAAPWTSPPTGGPSRAAARTTPYACGTWPTPPTTRRSAAP